jgi:hypothetical protein
MHFYWIENNYPLPEQGRRIDGIGARRDREQFGVVEYREHHRAAEFRDLELLVGYLISWYL